MFALELVDVSKRFGTRRALDGVDFAVAPGSALGLLGPNGAGKTTTLRLLLGFTQASSGSVRLRGLSPQDPASRVGVAYLPERMSMPGRMTVRSFLRLQGTLAGIASDGLDAEVDAALEQTGISERRGDRIGGLSKGLTQRVGFAQTFLGQPEVVLLDEPTSGLDPLGVRDARDWILAARQRGATVLVSSHLLSEVERTCDQIAIVHEGRIAAMGNLDEVVAPGESLEDAYIRLVRG